MVVMIQMLERRRLMSVTAETLTADAAAVVADAGMVMLASTARFARVNSDVLTITKDIKPLDTKANVAINNRLLQQLRGQVKFYNGQLAKDVSRVVAASKSAAMGGSKSGKALLKTPTNAGLIKSVGKTISYINTVLTARINALLPELTAAEFDGFEPYYTSIAQENPSLAGVTAAIDSDIAVKTTAVTNAANQLQTDANRLAGDLAGII